MFWIIVLLEDPTTTGAARLVKQEVMDYCLKVPKHSDELKK